MLEILDSRLRDLIEQALLTVDPADAQLVNLLRQYYRHADLDVIGQRDPGSLAEAVRAHRDLGATRARGETKAKAITPMIGGTPHRSVVLIVTEDVPYLVASVTNALENLGTQVRHVLHPEPLIARDVDGHLLEVMDESVDLLEEGFGRGRESWMSFELAETCDVERCADLTEAVGFVLADLQLALADWPRIEHRVHQRARELATVPANESPVSYAENAVAVEFLGWLTEQMIAFVGARDYKVEGHRRIPLRETDLGMCRSPRDRVAVQPMSMAVAPSQLLVVMKSSVRSVIYHTGYLDEITVRHFGPDGVVDREFVIFGMFSDAARALPVTEIPLVREKVAEVVRRTGFLPDTHGEQEVVSLLSSYPFDELLQDDVDHLTTVVLDAIHLGNRHTTRVFLRHSAAHDFVSVLIYLPRDRYVTPVRRRLEALLHRVFDADQLEFTARVSEDPRARLSYVVRRVDGSPIEPLSPAQVEALKDEIAATVRTWQQRLSDQVAASLGGAAAQVWRDFGRGFPPEYVEHFTTTQGVADLKRLVQLGPDHPTEVVLYRSPDGDPDSRRFKLFSAVPVSLAEVLPVFSHLGIEVTDERPYTVTRADGTPLRIYDLGLRVADPSVWERTGHDEMRALIEGAVSAIWRGDAESDDLNALVIRAGLGWREVVILRTLATYLQQGLVRYSLPYIHAALVANPAIAIDLVRLFEARFDPVRRPAGDTAADGGATAEEERVAAALTTALDGVRSLDHDRILRALLAVVRATLRTTYYQSGPGGAPRTDVAIKLSPQAVPGLPAPHPKYEIWVYSPRVEGSHLRFGAVARGGLRWSDRREDFRTEVLGLVKAQMTKNAVIVPTGSKGAFVPKRLPSPSDKKAWLAEGIAAYEIFVGAMLDLTDNRVGDEIVPPRDVVRHDGDDPYLVVAADKGTARLSDTANRISAEHGFWLDDAFASGGSAGYDHKAMGITARGAWESVRRHFRERGHDIQREDVTVVGIGDMSGDVFGNGMLRSPHIRLVAAFDHRHIFLDPTPDAQASLPERQRLYDLPGSSWDDYDRALISDGGGVHARTEKSVPISEPVRDLLDLPADTDALAPADLISAVLRAPVDLLWNGGIGTYVKASSETHAEVGDKANDALRVDGAALRVHVVGEGGNLGFTQRGRIEAAAQGIAINTDSIDNSAGVDTSDHEVNLKILFSGLLHSGDLTRPDRDALLQTMTDEVAAHVLRTNYDQNVLLGVTMFTEHDLSSIIPRALTSLEHHAGLDRDLEFLPSDRELARRASSGVALYQPENCVAIAYSKLSAKHAITDSDLPDDPWLRTTLAQYFPAPIRERYPEAIERHPLRREIIATVVANAMVNQGGFTFAFRAMEETGATIPHAARAFLATREVFDLRGYADAVEALDGLVPAAIQYRMLLAMRRLLDRGTRWFLTARPTHLDLTTEIEKFTTPLAALDADLGHLLVGGERGRFEKDVACFVDEGVPAPLAARAAGLLDAYCFLDIVEVATDLDLPPGDVAALYYVLSEEFGIDELLRQVAQLPRVDRWESLARVALRQDLYAVVEALTRCVLATGSTGTPQERIARWEDESAERVQRARTTLRGMDLTGESNIAALSVALRSLRSLVR